MEVLDAMGKDSTDVLGPLWGKPELFLSLAWSNLNLAVPNLPAAEMYAQNALEPVPHRHDVREILIPQINTVKEKRS